MRGTNMLNYIGNIADFGVGGRDDDDDNEEKIHKPKASLKGGKASTKTRKMEKKAARKTKRAAKKREKAARKEAKADVATGDVAGGFWGLGY